MMKKHLKLFLRNTISWKNRLITRKKVLFLLIFTSVFAPGFAQEVEIPPPDFEELHNVRESFTYEVKYSVFKLGWVDVHILPDTLYKGRVHKHLQTVIRSNSKNPFIGTEIDHYHSFYYLNEDGLPVTSRYWKDNVDEGIYEEIIYEFDRDSGFVYYKEEDGSQDTLDLVEPATAGHIIFQYSRLFAGSGLDSRQIVYISKDHGAINFQNGTELENRKYKPFGKISAVLTRGETENLEGPFGFSGKFRAWFLDDELRVPLEARVRVFLGNAIVRLIDYKKEEL